MDQQSTIPAQHPAPEKKKGANFFIEVLKFTVLAVIIIVPFRLYIAQPFIVSGASMDPAFETGEYLIVDQVSYKFEHPPRDSVVIFKYPKDQTKYFIKRIIGLPGETVEIHGTKVTIKNSEYPQGFVLDEPYIATHNEKNEELSVTLKEDEYFVMGDNRVGSSDSRMWGPVPASLIIGRPFMRLLPLGKLEFFPGNEHEKHIE